MANCTGKFAMPRHWTTYLPENNLTWNRTATQVADNQAINFSGTVVDSDRKLIENDNWG